MSGAQLVLNFSGVREMAPTYTVSGSNWNLEMLVSVEGGKPEYPEKNPWSKEPRTDN